MDRAEHHDITANMKIPTFHIVDTLLLKRFLVKYYFTVVQLQNYNFIKRFDDTVVCGEIVTIFGVSPESPQ